VDWIDVLTSIARASGSVALRHFRQDLTVETKADGSPVTLADRAAEKAAVEWITRHFPNDAILAEEGGQYGSPNAERRWVVDPIDGTISFVHGVPLWGTMIGVMTGETVIAGVVFCPALDEMVVAAQSAGCWYNGSRCCVSQVSDLARSTILGTSERFHGKPERQDRWKALAQKVALSRTGGDCYGYLLVATGRAEVMVDNRLSLWDYAPLVPIIREAGGVITDWRGSASFGGDAIATNRALADTVRRILVSQPLS
jgi:histidinol phosphatase-like enzyme (inositol monophosphatase family)